MPSKLMSSVPEKPVAPLELLVQLVGGADKAAILRRSTRATFQTPTSQQIAAYSIPLLNMLQTCDDPRMLTTVQQVARNKFGVTVLHKACRYPNWAVAKFLAQPRFALSGARDDLGRVPLHDACWNQRVDFTAIDALVDPDPSILLLEDNRGHTPLCFAPEKTWAAWSSYLRAKRDHIIEALEKSRSSSSPWSSSTCDSKDGHETKDGGGDDDEPDPKRLKKGIEDPLERQLATSLSSRGGGDDDTRNPPT